MKRILLLTVILLSAFINAQVGMNTTKPKATLDIEAVPNAETNGILIPRLSSAERSAFVNPERGLMVYNTDLKCYETNTGTPVEPKWQCLATVENIKILSIEPVGFKGNFRRATENDPSQNKVLFKVTNNTSGQLTGLDLSYINVEGSTQYIAEGQNNNVTIPSNSSKVLEYGISGGNWTDYSVFTLTYDQYSTASITLRLGTTKTPNGIGVGNDGTAKFGKTEKQLFLVKSDSGNIPIDKSFIITAEKPLKVKIPFTQGMRNYLAYTSPKVRVTDKEGNQRELQLKYPAGNLDIGTGEIEAEIISVDGEDLTLPQTSLGNTEIIARFPLKLNNTDKGTFDIIAFGGIPDRRFGDGSGHDFVYMPIQSTSGRIWLNNNLGAEYSNARSELFNPQQQAQSPSDIYARGSLFQYHRAPDGHELTSVDNEEYTANSNETNTLAISFTPNNVNVINNPKSGLANLSNRAYNWVNIDYKNQNIEEWNGLWMVNGLRNS